MPAAKGNRLNLVTGACGFAGSHLVKMLLDDNQKVIATDLAKAFQHPKNRFIYKNIGLDFSNPNCQIIPSDLIEKESLQALFQQPVTHVFHTASLYDYSAPMALLEKINVQGGRNLFEIAVKHKGLKRFFHWSTCGVFGKPHTAKEGKQCNIPFTEASCSSPRNTPIEQDQPTGTHLVNDYSVTKWKQEQIAWKMHREEGLPLTVIRPAPLYGPGSDYGHGGIGLDHQQGAFARYPQGREELHHLLGARGRHRRLPPLHRRERRHHRGGLQRGGRQHYLLLRLHQLHRPPPGPENGHHPLHPHAVPAAGHDLHRQHLADARGEIQGPAGPGFRGCLGHLHVLVLLDSNKKTKDTGYRYHYPDVREGLRDLIDWFRCVGWLDKSYRPEAAWKEFIETKQ